MDAKKKVFVRNAIRSLTKVRPTGNPRDIQFVVMVGGSALDFEIPNFVTDALADYDIVAGRGNIPVSYTHLDTASLLILESFVDSQQSMKQSLMKKSMTSVSYTHLQWGNILLWRFLFQ